MHARSPTKVAAQIIHFLKLSRSGWRQRVQDLGRDEIRQVVEDYGDAAARIRDASFDAVELHMAHAYTLSSFLSRAETTGRDEFGGRSVENRLRVPSLVLQRVRERVGPDFPVGIRFDGEEAIKDGYSVGDAALFAIRFARLGADWLSISAGGKFEDAVHRRASRSTRTPATAATAACRTPAYPDGLNVYLGEGVKRALNERGTRRSPSSRPARSARRSSPSRSCARAAPTSSAWPASCSPIPTGRRRCARGARTRSSALRLQQRLQGAGRAVPPRPLHAVAQARPAGAAGAEDEAPPPVWPEGAALSAHEVDGRVRLAWTPATDDDRGDGGTVYGYMVLRSEADGPWIHVDSARGVAHRFDDASALGGTRYRYRIVAYDLAGNRSQPLGPVDIRLGTNHA